MGQTISETTTGLIPQWGDASAMFSLSTALVGKAEDYVSTLEQIASQLTAPIINFIPPAISATPVPVTVAVPTFTTPAFNIPTQPAAFSGALDISSLLPGALTVTAPTLNFGSPPTPFTTTAPASPGVDLNFDYPTVAITLPNPPTLLSLDTVVFNALAIPTFSASVPNLTAVAPSVVQYREGMLFTSQLLTDLETALDNAITTGALDALAAQAQQALFDAGREREYRAQADALLELDRMTETLGFAFPPGVYVDARIKLQTETTNTLAGISRDIMYKQADLQLQNIISARKEAVDLESKLIDYTNQVAQRAFETTKYATEASIAIYNAQVQAYTASLDGYRTQATVYQAQIQGIQAQVAIYNAEIEFERVKTEMNTALISQYKVQVDAALANLEIFKVETQIIQVRAEIEKTKIEAFGAQIQAFVAQVNAYTAQIEGYKATVQTQAVIENVYKTQVDAYGVTVDAGVKAADAVIEQYKGRIQGYEAQLDAFKTNLQAMVEQARAAALVNENAARVYTAEVQAVSAYNQLLTAQWEAITNEQEKIAEVAVKAAEANGQLFISSRQLQQEGTKTAATVMAQLGAASLNAIHWSNSSSWALSQAASINSSISNVTSTSTNTNTNISESA
jgi:hypothetical protein